jgi:hypothetical protein
MEHRQVEPLFVLFSLVALVACAARLVPSVAQSSPTPVPVYASTARSLSVPHVLQVRPDKAGDATVPAGCVVRDAESQAYQNVEDGYCLRYPSHFRLGEVFPGIANFYGPPRVPGSEPLAAGLVIQVVDVDGEQGLAGVVERYVQEQQRVGWLSPAYTQTATTLGGQPAVLLEGPGEYTPLHILLTVYEGKRYTLSIWPDADEFPVVSDDVRALWQTVPSSFSFLHLGGRDQG